MATHRGMAALCCLVLGLSSRLVEGNPPAKPLDSPEQPPLELKVTMAPWQQRPGDLEPNHIASGSSLQLQVELHNTGDQPVRIFWGSGAIANGMRLSIDAPGGRTMVTSGYDAPLRPERARDKDVLGLPPQGRATGMLTTGPFGRQQFFFRTPGKYRLTASFKVDAVQGDVADAESWTELGTVTAEPMTFTVAASDEHTGPGDVRIIRGQVTDAERRPVRGADVHLQVERTSMHHPTMAKEFRAFDRTVTDEQGHFEFPDIPGTEPRVRLGVYYKLLPEASQVVAIDPQQAEMIVDFQLLPARRVTGVVVDEQGQPLADVAIRRMLIPGFPQRNGMVTEDDGRFEVTGLHADEDWYVGVNKRGWEVVDDSHRFPAGAETATIVMRPRPEADHLEGVAAFDDGQPAGNRELTIWFDREENRPIKLTCVTESDGRFSVALPTSIASADRPLSVVAEVAGPVWKQDHRTGQPQIVDAGKNFHELYLARNRWLSRFQVQDDPEPVRLEFDRSHSLEIQMTSQESYGPEIDVRVRLALLQDRWPRLIAEDLLPGDRLENLTYRDLSPGTYQVEVRLEQAHDLTRTETVEIPLEAQAREHELSVSVPDVRFGRVKVLVEDAAGRLPGDGVSVRLNPTGHRTTAFPLGRDGMVVWPHVPAGRVWVSCQQAGFHAEPTQGQVVADQETVIGPLILRPEEEVFGEISGRVLLADRTAALGAEVTVGLLAGTSQGAHRVNGTGAFDPMKAREGEQLLKVWLDGCDLWPHGSATAKAHDGFGFGEGPQLHRSVVQPQTVRAGQHQTTEFVLPNVGFRNLAVDIGEHVPFITIDVPLEGMHFRADFTLTPKGELEIPHIPARPGRLTVHGWHSTPGGASRSLAAGVVPFTAEQSSLTIFDPTRAGRLLVKSVREGVTRFDCKYRVCLPGDALSDVLAMVTGQSHELDQRADEEGFVSFSLSPGAYRLVAVHNGDRREQVFDIRDGETHRVILDFSNGD